MPTNGPAKRREVVLSSGAGRLLFALLLSPTMLDHSLVGRVAGLPNRLLPPLFQEISQVAGEQPPKNETRVDAAPPSVGADWGAKDSIAQYDKGVHIEGACTRADALVDPGERLREQALAVVGAWEYYYPTLSTHEDIKRRQKLRPQKAREWVSLVSGGHEAATISGWLGEVEEGKLLSMQLPLAYMHKMVVRRASVGTGDRKTEPEEAGVDEVWREYARKILEQGGMNGNQKGGGHLSRIAGAIQSSPGEP